MAAPLDAPDDTLPDRRRADRRARRTPFLTRRWLTGRRRAGRRSGETADAYFDRYGFLEWFLVGGVVLLSLADLIFTLDYLAKGGEEANPIMNAALQRSEGLFIGVKMGVTVLGALFLLIHVRFRRVKGLLSVVFLLYCVLTVYHLHLRAEHPLMQGADDGAIEVARLAEPG